MATDPLIPPPGRLGQLTQQLGQFVDEHAVEVGAKAARNHASPWSLVGSGRMGAYRASVSIPSPPAAAGWAAGCVGARCALDLAAVAAAGPLLGQPLGAFGAVGDGGHPPLGTEPAFGVELDHGAVAERFDLLAAAQPHPMLAMGATRSRELTLVEGHEHRVEGRRGGLAGTLGGRGDGALADGLGVAGGHAQPMAGERLTQRRPGDPELGRGGVDAAEFLGQREGAFGFGPV